MQPFRTAHPKRTYRKKFKDYRSYKQPLRNDFAESCGYCGDGDVYCGGKNGYHIDHLRPLHFFTHLECEYENLVYACPFCNTSKSDDWPCKDPDKTHKNGEGYIDPCDPDYPTQFERNDSGQIIAKTAVAKYMFKQLKLGLQRHQLIWMMTKLFSQIEELSRLHPTLKDSPGELQMLRRHLELFNEYARYKNSFETSI